MSVNQHFTQSNDKATRRKGGPRLTVEPHFTGRLGPLSSPNLMGASKFMTPGPKEQRDEVKGP